ncbi:UDP-N-acetylmuramate dehydrogenase, partial [bacterium]
LTTFAAFHELSGLEPLSGIPGSVGGGLWMNAGAYGGEISNALIDVDVITPNDEMITLQAAEIGFGYRSAPVLQDKVILHSRFKLTRGNKDSIYSEMRRVWRLRREKQPLEYPSAGSIFKRPAGDYAGRLIEAVNGKGVRIGGAMVPHKHAGIFINYDHATAEDVVQLIREIRQRVYDKFGILLENEVKPVGFKNDPFEIKS